MLYARSTSFETMRHLRRHYRRGLCRLHLARHSCLYKSVLAHRKDCSCLLWGKTCLKAALSLALGACIGLDFMLCVLIVWPQDKATLCAVILHHLQLWEDACPPCHYPKHPDEFVQMELPVETVSFMGTLELRRDKESYESCCHYDGAS